MDHFGHKNDASSTLWGCCKNFFKIFHGDKGQHPGESNNGLYQKFFVKDRLDYFGPENGTSL